MTGNPGPLSSKDRVQLSILQNYIQEINIYQLDTFVGTFITTTLLTKLKTFLMVDRTGHTLDKLF